MKQIKITGGNTLTGEIKISGAKNSAVALIPAAILCDETATIFNVPNISDIDALSEILEYLNAGVKREDDAIIIDSSSIVNKEIPKGISKKLRASYYFMSALLGKYKKVEMVAVNAPSGSYAAGCPEKGYGNTYDCKRCERAK